MMCSGNPLLCTVFMSTNVSSTLLFHRLWGGDDVLRAWLQNFLYIYGLLCGLMLTSWQLLPVVHITCPGTGNMCSLSKTPKRQMMLFTVIDVLCWSSLSCTSWSWMILMTGPLGTDVKSAFTSYDMIHSSCYNWIPLDLLHKVIWYCGCVVVISPPEVSGF